jgi:hypothetical protein
MAACADAVDRAALSKFVLGDGKEDEMKRLEAAVHPLLEHSRAEFLAQVCMCCVQVLCICAACMLQLFKCGIEYACAKRLQAPCSGSCRWVPALFRMPMAQSAAQS